jgi:hypothetical protein
MGTVSTKAAPTAGLTTNWPLGFAVKYSREYDEALRDTGTPTVWLVEEAFESRMAAVSYARRPALSTDAVLVQGA